MSATQFHDAVDRMPDLFDQLMACDLLAMRAPASWHKLHAVYVFYDVDGMPCHTGRTRNLQGRVRAHKANSHHSASFAFKRARQALDLKATYRPEGSRQALMNDVIFKDEFDRQREQVGLMKLRYVEIESPIEQHLFELYTALRLGTSLSEFTTS